MSDEKYIEHEVRIRIQEQFANTIYAEVKELKRDIESNFKWTIGIMFAMFGGLLITKLI